MGVLRATARRAAKRWTLHTQWAPVLSRAVGGGRRFLLLLVLGSATGREARRGACVCWRSGPLAPGLRWLPRWPVVVGLPKLLRFVRLHGTV